MQRNERRDGVVHLGLEGWSGGTGVCSTWHSGAITAKHAQEVEVSS